MHKDLTLLIMAAGMGSRFGGLKQIESIGPNGEFIIDYSIYDAVKAGFNKVVFVIKEENYEIFKETIGNRIAKYIEVDYVFQSLQDIPEGYKLPENRIKPLGTAHAVYSARYKINGPFAVINADDFYGRDAYFKVANFLLNEDNFNKYSIVGYNVKNTLSENGSVKRAVIDYKDGILEKLTESSIEENNSIITASPLDGSPSFEVKKDTLVCMNMLGFQKNIFKYIENKFIIFLEENKEKLIDCEFFIPNIIYEANKENYAKVEIIETSSKWYGITYKEDKNKVVQSINDLVKQGEYPKRLW